MYKSKKLQNITVHQHYKSHPSLTIAHSLYIAMFRETQYTKSKEATTARYITGIDIFPLFFPDIALGRSSSFCVKTALEGNRTGANCQNVASIQNG